jgi:hypothetical protein
VETKAILTERDKAYETLLADPSVDNHKHHADLKKSVKKCILHDTRTTRSKKEDCGVV